MMHTPDQARELWCPMVRLKFGSASYNRTTDLTVMPYGSRCIADKCAMWRWGEFKEAKQEAIVPDPSFGAGGMRVTMLAVKVPVAGYCGLAGRPEMTP